MLFFGSGSAPANLAEASADKLPAAVDKLFVHGASRSVVAKRLRNIGGKAVIAWTPHRFVDFVTTCLGDEVAGTWLDRWKMSSLLRTTPFGFLTTVNSVEKVLVVEANSLVLHCKHGDSTVPVVHTIGKGLDELSALQRLVAAELSKAGNNHWGTHMDVDILSNELKIHFCIVGNEPVRAVPAAGEVVPHVLHAYTCPATTVNLWVALYNISHQHFQSLFFDLENGFQSAFSATEFPASLADVMRSSLSS